MSIAPGVRPQSASYRRGDALRRRLGAGRGNLAGLTFEPRAGEDALVDMVRVIRTEKVRSGGIESPHSASPVLPYFG